MFLKKARLRDQKWFAQITALSLSLTAGAFGTVGTEAAAQTIVAYVVQSDRGDGSVSGVKRYAAYGPQDRLLSLTCPPKLPSF